MFGGAEWREVGEANCKMVAGVARGVTAGVAAMQGELRGTHTNARSVVALAGTMALPWASCMFEPLHYKVEGVGGQGARWRGCSDK